MPQAKHISHTNVPTTAHSSAQARAAFSRILMQLFDEYPSDNVDAQLYRKHALWCLGEAAEGDDEEELPRPREAAFMACDTGIPNDVILSAYAMIFT